MYVELNMHFNGEHMTFIAFVTGPLIIDLICKIHFTDEYYSCTHDLPFQQTKQLKITKSAFPDNGFLAFCNTLDASIRPS